MTGKRRISLILVACVLISLSLTVLASTDTIEVIFDNIRIKVNGQIIEPDTEPFLYNGRTYVPVRAIAEGMKSSVIWNEETKLVDVQFDDSQDMTLSAKGITAMKTLFFLSNVNNINWQFCSEYKNSLQKILIFGGAYSTDAVKLKELNGKLEEFEAQYIEAVKTGREFISKYRNTFASAKQPNICVNDVLINMESMDSAIEAVKTYFAAKNKNDYNSAMELLDSIGIKADEISGKIIKTNQAMCIEHQNYLSDAYLSGTILDGAVEIVNWQEDNKEILKSVPRFNGIDLAE